jgi:Zn finger protein HypA/HybF involved in hydrogenase expression
MKLKIKDHIDTSKNIVKCKSCKKLYIIKFLDQKLCNDCDKIYRDIINKII